MKWNFFKRTQDQSIVKPEEQSSIEKIKSYQEELSNLQIDMRILQSNKSKIVSDIKLIKDLPKFLKDDHYINNIFYIFNKADNTLKQNIIKCLTEITDTESKILHCTYNIVKEKEKLGIK